MSRNNTLKILHVARTPAELIFALGRRKWQGRLTSPYGAKPTPEPVLETFPTWPPLDSPAFAEALANWHKEHNGG